MCRYSGRNGRKLGLKHIKATEETQRRNEKVPQKASRGLNFKKHVENIKKVKKKKKKGFILNTYMPHLLAGAGNKVLLQLKASCRRGSEAAVTRINIFLPVPLLIHSA